MICFQNDDRLESNTLEINLFDYQFQKNTIDWVMNENRGIEK